MHATAYAVIPAAPQGGFHGSEASGCCFRLLARVQYTVIESIIALAKPSCTFSTVLYVGFEIENFTTKRDESSTTHSLWAPLTTALEYQPQQLEVKPQNSPVSFSKEQSPSEADSSQEQGPSAKLKSK